MNVLNVNMSIDPVTGGGTAERTIQVARFLSKAGIKSSILSSDIGIEPDLYDRLENVDLYTLHCPFPRYYFHQISYKRLKNIISRHHIIHLMNHWTMLNAVVYLICRKLNKPYVVCPAGALPIFGRSKQIKKIYNMVIGKRIIQNASGHIAIPPEEAEHYRDYGVDPKGVSVIANGIDPDDFSAQDDNLFRRKHGLGADPLILFVGRLNYIKGPDLLLNAFAGIHDKFADYKLVFAGPDSGMLDQLKIIAKKLRIEDRVHFVGYVGGIEKSWAYHTADLLVIPSRQEAMSIVAIEAGIAGTPVLITDVCGLGQIRDIDGGIVVGPTIKGIQIGLTALKDPEHLKRMGHNLKRFVENNYTWESMIPKYIKLFKDILYSA